MGYQALLFCPDEKLARVVTQVFGDLDFAVEPVHEPFAAVKKLMAQRFDAIVVDCENEQNASLLFKSARNSSSNQSSLAIALVLGQAGVAKAYRIGANLVLTKPINIEQAKGTLRVARGLLRKNSDVAGSTASVPPSAETPLPASASVQPASPIPAGTNPASTRFETVGGEPRSSMAPLAFAAVPGMARSAQTEEIQALYSPSAQSNSEAPEPSVLSFDQNLDGSVDKDDAVLEDNTAEEVAKNEIARKEAPQIAAALPPAVSTPSSSPATTPVALSITSGSAAAPAPAKEALAFAAKPSAAVKSEPARLVQESTSTVTSSFASMASAAPSFGILNEEPSEGSAGKKKILIIAAVVLVVAALGYFGYGKFSHSASPQPPLSVPHNTSESAPAQAPVTSQAPTVSTSSQPASSAVQAPASKTSAAVSSGKPLVSAGSPPVIHIDADPAPETKKPESAPIVVMSSAQAARNPVATDESAPALPNAADPASASDTKLSALMPSSSSAAKPSLATLKVSQGVSQGLVIKRVQPTYPQAALAVHSQGAVQIEATITKEGTVTNLKVLSGDPVLSRAALEAVRQWRYKPYYLDGQPVEIQTQITVNFKAN